MDRQWWEAAISGRGKQGSVHPADTLASRKSYGMGQAHDSGDIAGCGTWRNDHEYQERYAVKEDGTPAGSYYDYQIKNGEGYELRISENDIYDDRDRGGLLFWI